MKMEVKIPAVGESINEATIGEWLKQNGDYVEQDEVILSLETDKASVEIVAEKAGVLTTKAEEGDELPIGAVVAEIDTAAAKPAGAATPQATPSPETPSSSSTDSSTSAHPELQKHLSPAVSQVVAQKGLDPQSIQGTGRGGRITKGDALSASPTAPQASSKPTASIPDLPVVSSGPQGSERVKMSRIRQKTAEKLVEAQHTAAILTTFNEVDMSALIRLRNEYKEAFEKKHGIRLGFMGFFIKACIEALKAYPAVNAQIDGTDIVYNHFHNIGVAVGTPKGLVVPVVKNADQMSIAQIETAIRHYALKARDGKISIDDLSGGTFTVSNGGVYGSLMSTPILNPPQSGILGMHKTEDRPVAINGKVEIRPMMYLALSYDHRIIDGKESVSFLVRIKECLEDPSRMLLDV